MVVPCYPDFIIAVELRQHLLSGQILSRICSLFLSYSAPLTRPASRSSFSSISLSRGVRRAASGAAAVLSEPCRGGATAVAVGFIAGGVTGVDEVAAGLPGRVMFVLEALAGAGLAWGVAGAACLATFGEGCCGGPAGDLLSCGVAAGAGRCDCTTGAAARNGEIAVFCSICWGGGGGMPRAGANRGCPGTSCPGCGKNCFGGMN